MQKTTLNDIKKEKPCEEGWKKLLKSLNKTKPDPEILTLEHILNSNGLSDACWVAGIVLGLKRELRLYSYWVAKQAKKYVKDKNKYNKIINTVNLSAYGYVMASSLESARASALASTIEPARASALASAREYAWSSAWASALESDYNKGIKLYSNKFI